MEEALDLSSDRLLNNNNKIIAGKPLLLVYAYVVTVVADEFCVSV